MGPTSALLATARGSFDFSGRSTRAEFWWSWIILLPIAQLLLAFRGLEGDRTASWWVMTVAIWLIALPLLAVGTRRLADAGLWRWLFVLVFHFGLLAKWLYSIPVPAEGAMDGLQVQFDDKTVAAENIGYFPALRLAHDVMPWIGRLLALLCLLLTLLPTHRQFSTVSAPHEVTQ